jgi:hypothetical protein
VEFKTVSIPHVVTVGTYVSDSHFSYTETKTEYPWTQEGAKAKCLGNYYAPVAHCPTAVRCRHSNLNNHSPPLCLSSALPAEGQLLTTAVPRQQHVLRVCLCRRLMYAVTISVLYRLHCPVLTDSGSYEVAGWLWMRTGAYKEWAHHNRAVSPGSGPCTSCVQAGTFRAVPIRKVR